MARGRGLQGYIHIGRIVNSGPSDQIDLNLGGGGKLTYEGGADWWDP
jgi:hypothetical protein